MIIVKDIEQLSGEWYAARAGVPSSSCFDKIVTSKGERSKSHKGYMYTLAGETIIKEKAPTYQSRKMVEAMEMEDEARSKYEYLYDCDVEQVALCYKNKSKLFSCSPDGLIGNDGGIEIKCPNLNTHVGYMLGGKLPTDYIQQVQGTLFITGREWWDFVSYYPGMPLFRVRVDPDKEFHEKLDTELVWFCHNLDGIVKKLKAYK